MTIYGAKKVLSYWFMTDGELYVYSYFLTCAVSPTSPRWLLCFSIWLNGRYNCGDVLDGLGQMIPELLGTASGKIIVGAWRSRFWVLLVLQVPGKIQAVGTLYDQLSV